MLCIIGCYNIIFLDPTRFWYFGIWYRMIDFSMLSDVFSMTFIDIELLAFDSVIECGSLS